MSREREPPYRDGQRPADQGREQGQTAAARLCPFLGLWSRAGPRARSKAQPHRCMIGTVSSLSAGRSSEDAVRLDPRPRTRAPPRRRGRYGTWARPGRPGMHLFGREQKGSTCCPSTGPATRSGKGRECRRPPDGTALDRPSRKVCPFLASPDSTRLGHSLGNTSLAERHPGHAARQGRDRYVVPGICKARAVTRGKDARETHPSTIESLAQ